MSESPGGGSSWASFFMLFAYFVYIAHLTKFTRGSSLILGKYLPTEKIKSGRNSLVKKGKKRAQRRRKENHSVKKRKTILYESDWYWLELRAGVLISNKEVAVKPKSVIHKVKNQVSFYFYKYQP